MLRKLIIVFAATLAIGFAAFPTNASAQWHRGWHGGGWGYYGGGFAAGAILGGLLAAPYYYGPGPYYPAPGYYGPPPGDAVAYCMQRFKSYDPRSGTYLGYDGYRHPCP
jgi:BA14K-like protein